MTAPVAPAWWAEYRKALVVVGFGLVTTLTELAADLARDGVVTPVAAVHLGITFVGALLAAAGAAAVPNVYPRAELVRRLGGDTPPAPRPPGMEP